MARPVKKLRPWPETGAEVSAKQEGGSWISRVKNTLPRRSPAPSFCLSSPHCTPIPGCSFTPRHSKLPHTG